MKFSIALSAICIVLTTSAAQADIISDCEQVLDDAQQVYPEYFPSNPETQFIGPWCFRRYGDVYAGVYLDMQGALTFEGVYTLGGPFGGTPLYIDQTSNVMTMLSSQLRDNIDDQTAICNNTSIPSGFKYTRDGDSTEVTTQDQCLELPLTQTICEPFPELDENKQAIATGIHALSQNSISEFELTGVNVVLPGVPSIPDALKQEIINDQQCTIHASAEYIEHQVNTDICLDITEQLGSFATYPGMTPPITMYFAGNTNATRVDDCFKTDASTITNLVTGEQWTNQNGSFIKDSE